MFAVLHREFVELLRTRLERPCVGQVWHRETFDAGCRSVSKPFIRVPRPLFYLTFLWFAALAVLMYTTFCCAGVAVQMHESGGVSFNSAIRR